MVFNNWPRWIKFNRKVPHINFDGGSVDHVQSLVDHEKEFRLFKLYWGPGSHVINVEDKDKTSLKMLEALKSFSKKNVNY